MRASNILVSAFSALFLMVNSAYAADLIDAENPSEILNIARGFGSAKLEEDSDGDPRIRGRIDGTAYYVWFYGCEKNIRCDDIQFSAGWSGEDVSITDVNEWNASKRFGKAYIDDEGDPIFQMTVNIDHGVSERNMEDTFEWWKSALEEFKEEVLGQ